MADHEGGPVRTVVWSELFPWLSLLRTFRLAVGFRVLVLSALAIVLTAIGWWLLGRVFLGADAPTPAATALWTDLSRAIPEPYGLPGPDRVRETPEVRGGPWWSFGPFVGVWARLSAPLVAFFQGPVPGVAGLAYFVLAGLWGLAVWALLGGAITRIVAVQLACEERISWTAVVRHATRKWLAYFSAPLFPLMGVLLSAVPVCVLGLLMRAEVGLFVAGLVWPLMLICGLLMALLLLGLAFGWPLMWATISSEGTDSFDALSRSYAYVFQRPLHYLFYTLVVTVLGLLAWLLVWYFSAAVIGLTYWAAGWGAGPMAVDAVRIGGGGIAAAGDAAKFVAPPMGSVGQGGAWLIHFWTGVVKLLAVSFLFGYFWTSATAIYFLLRRDVDATEMDEVYLEEEEQTYGLPPLKTDEAGAPVVGEPAPAAKPDEE
jgi:hypothetical protein